MWPKRIINERFQKKGRGHKNYVSKSQKKFFFQNRIASFQVGLINITMGRKEDSAPTHYKIGSLNLC